MRVISRFLEKDEKVIWIAKKHKFMLFVAFILSFFLVLPAAIVICGNVPYIFDPNLCFTSDKELYDTALSFLMLLPFFIVMIKFLDSKLIFTNKRVIVKKSFSRRLLLVPYSDLAKALYHNKFETGGVKLLPINLYSFSLYLADGTVMKTTGDFNDKNLIEIKGICEIYCVPFSKESFTDCDNAYREVNVTDAKLADIFSFIPPFIATVLPLLSFLLAFYLAAGLNSKVGVPHDLIVTGTITEKKEFGGSTEKYEIWYTDDADGWNSDVEVDSEFYKKAEIGMRIEITGKRGSLGILYDLEYRSINEFDKDDDGKAAECFTYGSFCV